MQAINVLDTPAQRVVEGVIGMELAVVLAQLLAAGGSKSGYIPLYIAAFAFTVGGKSAYYVRFWCSKHNQWHGGEVDEIAREGLVFLLEGLRTADVMAHIDLSRPVGRS